VHQTEKKMKDILSGAIGEMDDRDNIAHDIAP